LRRHFLVVALVVVALVGTIAALAAIATGPAAALPSDKSDCSSCHSATPSGTVSAVPSTTTPAPGATYKVNISVDLSASGQAGYWIINNDPDTPNPNLAGGPGSSPFSPTLTAPSDPGTYTYKVYGVKGKPSTGGQTETTTYQITVTAVTDTVAPTVKAPSRATVKKGKTATLKYRVNDPAPNLGTAKATIKIKNKKGKVVKTLKLGAKPVNTTQKAKFKCKLAKGKYTFYVTAVDAAGNHSRNTAKNKLIVK
jgi:hypothetical protein